MTTAQLPLWVDATLADDLVDRPCGAGGGAGRLLRDLGRLGLAREHLAVAAALVVELDRAARDAQAEARRRDA